MRTPRCRSTESMWPPATRASCRSRKRGAVVTARLLNFRRVDLLLEGGVEATGVHHAAPVAPTRSEGVVFSEAFL
jgi:hypothetical protein